LNLHLMDTNLIVLAAVAILIAVVLVRMDVQMRRSATAWLRQEFGSEYDRAVKVYGSKRKAEGKLKDREKRVEKLDLRKLDPGEQERFSKRWESVESRFIDSPKGAVTEADDLLSSLMKARGYPVADFDQRAADISVDHPRLMETYRSAHAIAVRIARDAATTEELRTAMIDFRFLFEAFAQMPASVERKEVA
jgi:hypothetical protein